jgi:hypothetical protein
VRLTGVHAIFGHMNRVNQQNRNYSR